MRIAALLILVLLTSCVTYNKCLDKFGKLSKDTLYIPVKEVFTDTVTVITPADSLQDHFNIDSLLAVVDTVRQESASHKLLIKLWKDKFNRQLHFKVRSLPDTVFVIERDTVDRLVACPPSVVFDPDKDARWYVKLWEYYKFFAAIALLVLVFVLWILARLKSANPFDHD